MALRPIDIAPKEDDFTPLQAHQEQTPDTFFGGKPVLYAHYPNLTLAIPTNKLPKDSAIANLAAVTSEHAAPNDSLIENVDVWVTSSDLILFQKSPTPRGVSILYPQIYLHATMDYKPRVGCVFMHVGLTDTETVNNEDDIEIVEVNILPPNFTSTPDRSCIEGIFNAMNICADFHPDPDDSEEEDEEDETAPGATGWITAENMGEYLDENGNFRGQVWGRETVELGPGAGTVRPREEDGEGQADVNGGDDTKWQRTG